MKFGALSHNCAHDSIARTSPAIQCFLCLEVTQYVGRATASSKMTQALPVPLTLSRAFERSRVMLVWLAKG